MHFSTSHFLLLFASFICFSTPSVAAVRNALTSETSSVILTGPFSGLSPEEVLTSSSRELRKEKGIKLNFTQRLALRIAKRSYRKDIKQTKKQALAKKAGKKYTVGIIALILGGIGAISILIFLLAGVSLTFGVLGLLGAMAAILLGIIGLFTDRKPWFSIGAILLGFSIIVGMSQVYVSF